MMPDSNKVMRGLQFCEYEYCENSEEDCPYKREKNCKQKLIRDTIEEIKQLNSITAIRKEPERKTGHWICIGGTVDKYGIKTTMFRCSEYNERTDRVDTKRSINFCPMCGAKMEEIKQ